MNDQSLTIASAIRNRRSIKKFNGQPVDPDLLQSLVEAAAWAPNHGNREPWRVIKACAEEKEELLRVLQQFGVPNAAQLSEEELSAQMRKFSTAGAYLFIIAPEDVRQKERLEDYAAATIFAYNVQLLAWDRGVGSCWKTPAFLDHPKFRRALGVEPGERIISMLQLGYFDELPKGKERRPAAEFLTPFSEKVDA